MQKKRLFWEKEQRWVSIKLSVKALRTVKKKGLDVVAEENGVDLYTLPYNDVSEARLQWKAANPVQPPMAKNARFVSKMIPAAPHDHTSKMFTAAFVTYNLTLTL